MQCEHLTWRGLFRVPLLCGCAARVVFPIVTGGFVLIVAAIPAEAACPTAPFQGDGDDRRAATYFAGYRRESGEAVFGVAAAAGRKDAGGYTREIANNLVAGGLEWADGDPDGTFATISATATTRWESAFEGVDVIPLVRAGYAGLFHDAFTESGAASDVSFDRHAVHMLEARAQLGIAVATHGSDVSRSSIKVRGGISGRVAFAGDDPSFQVDGISSTAPSATQADSRAGVFGGISYAFALLDGRAAGHIDLEGHLDTDGSRRVRGSVGGQVAF